MVRRLERRWVIRTAVGVSGAIAGCTQALPGADGDVIVRNRDATSHTVSVTFDRGSSYATETKSATVESRQQERLRDLIPTNDAPYGFLLDISVDGSHVETSQHRLQGEDVTVTIQTEEDVNVTKRVTDVTVTPMRERRNNTG